MKKKVLILTIGCCLSFSLSSQSESAENYRNFPIVLTLQFHSLTLPFRDFKSNFSNLGIGLGTEVGWNGKHNWAQQFDVVWYRNKTVGDGLLLQTQLAWRQSLFSNSFAGLQLGAGYLIASRPTTAYQQINNRWTAVGRKGKGMFTLSLGLSAGFHSYDSDTYISPFASYQFLLLNNYNESVPLVPETLLQMGARIHLKN